MNPRSRQPISTDSEWSFELIRRYDQEIARLAEFVDLLGVIVGQLLDRLLDLSKNYEPNPTFVNWVKQADWLILREFRPDILMDEENISFWQHISTQWLYRLMRSI